jgi:hypothetical protein
VPVATDDVVWLDVLPSMGRFRQELQQGAGSSADAAGKEAGTKFTGAFGKALKVGAVLGGALAVGGGAAFLKEATREASDLGESLNAVKVTFGATAGGINELGKAAAESVGLSQSQFNSLAVQFSAFATTIAGDGGDVVGTMKDLTTRGADFASVMNLDVNEAMGLFQSGLAGETEPLRKYGIDLSAAAVESYALSHGIAESAGSMTEAQKVQARYAYLMEQTSKVQGDFSNTSDSLANSQRILGARWDDIQAKVGGYVIPTLEKFSGWVVSSGLPALQNLGGWIQTTFGPILDEIVGGINAFGAAWKYNDGDITSSGFPGFMERVAFIGRGLWDFLSGTLVPTLSDLGSTVLPPLGTAFKTVGDAVMGTLTFFREHETAAKVLGGTVAFVAGLVAGAWVAQATVSAINSVKSIAAWFATATASTTSATIQSRSTAQIVVGWLAAAASATWNAVKIAAAWALSVAQTGVLMALYASQSIAAAARSTAAWLAAQARTVASLVATGAQFVIQGAIMAAQMAITAARVVAGWVLMGVQSMLQAARMAAAWFIALGPVGWIIATIIGLVALVIANWETVKRKTIEIWNGLVGAVKDGASTIWTWVTEKFTWLKDRAIGIFTEIRDTVGRVWDGLLDKVKTPIRIAFDFVNNNMVNPVNDILSKFPGNLKIPSLPRLATGGLLRGPGTGTSDSILGVDPRTGTPTAAVSNGEYVVKASRVRQLGVSFMDMLNAGRLPGLRIGGLAGRFGVPARGLGGWLSDRWDDTKGVAQGTWDAAKNAASSVKNFATDMLAKGARKAAEMVLGPIRNAVNDLIPNQVPMSMLEGGVNRLFDAVMGKGDEQDKAQQALAANTFSAGGKSPNGVGGLGPVAQAARQDVMRRFGLTNIGGYSYRTIAGTGQLSDHALGKAIDVMIPNYKSAAGIAKGNEVANYFTSPAVAKQYGVKYVIWNDRINSGSGWKPYGHPGGGRSDTLQHRDHDHISFFDQGGLWKSGTAGINLTGGVERVLTPPQDAYFRRFVEVAERAPSGDTIRELHLHEIGDMHNAIGEVNHFLGVYNAGGRYVPTGD